MRVQVSAEASSSETALWDSGPFFASNQLLACFTARPTKICRFRTPVSILAIDCILGYFSAQTKILATLWSHGEKVLQIELLILVLEALSDITETNSRQV